MSLSPHDEYISGVKHSPVSTPSLSSELENSLVFDITPHSPETNVHLSGTAVSEKESSQFPKEPLKSPILPAHSLTPKQSTPVNTSNPSMFDIKDFLQLQKEKNDLQEQLARANERINVLAEMKQMAGKDSQMTQAQLNETREQLQHALIRAQAAGAVPALTQQNHELTEQVHTLTTELTQLKTAYQNAQEKISTLEDKNDQLMQNVEYLTKEVTIQRDNAITANETLRVQSKREADLNAALMKATLNEQSSKDAYKLLLDVSTSHFLSFVLQITPSTSLLQL